MGIWEEELPEEQKVALIHVGNYHGISLLTFTYKILSKALLTRLEKQMDLCLGNFNGVQEKQVSSTKQIFNLKSVIRRYNVTGKNIVMVFMDFMKAYDHIGKK